MKFKWILVPTLIAASLGLGQYSRAQLDSQPNVNAVFPEIHDWNTLRITLSRSGCYGRCPAYKIEIHGDGTVLYDGDGNVAHKGRHTAKISHASLAELVDFFRKASYFSLRDRYTSGITDNPAYETSISFDGVSKSVLDYVGQSVGMPSPFPMWRLRLTASRVPPNGSDAREPSKPKLIQFLPLAPD